MMRCSAFTAAYAAYLRYLTVFASGIFVGMAIEAAAVRMLLTLGAA